MKYSFSRYMLSSGQKYMLNNINSRINPRSGKSRNRKTGRAGRDRVNHKLYTISAKQYVPGVNNRVFTFYKDLLEPMWMTIGITDSDQQRKETLDMFLSVLKGITNGSLRRYFCKRYFISYDELYPR